MFVCTLAGISSQLESNVKCVFSVLGDDTWCVQKECVLPTGVTPDLASVNTTGPDVLARARRDTPHHHRLCLLTCSRRYNMHPVEQQRYALVTVFHYSGSCKRSEVFSLTS